MGQMTGRAPYECLCEVVVLRGLASSGSRPREPTFALIGSPAAAIS